MSQPDRKAELHSSSAFRAYANATAALAGMPDDAPYPGAPTRRIVIATSGTLVVTKDDGQSETLYALPDGGWWDLQVALITGGTATNIVVQW